MPEILETNVKIKADASSLKKEAKESVRALEEIEHAQSELSQDTRDEIQSMVDEYNRLAAEIKKFTSGEYTSGQMAEWADSILGNLYTNIDKVKERLSDFTLDIPAEQLSQEVRNIVDRQESVKVPVELEVDDSKAVEIDKTSSKLDGLKKKLDEIKQKWDNAFKGSSGLKQLSKFVLSLAGIRTIFTLISRSMSTYLSQNDALREKLNAIYYAIGSMLAPILEWIINLFAKLVLYVNAFLKGLGFAGIQFKSISNGAKKTQKAMEKVKTLISGFDELNIFNKQATDQAEDAANAVKDPFADVEVNQEWIDKLYKLGEKLRPVLEWVIQKCKEIWDWLIKHKELVLAIIAVLAGIVAAAKIGELITKLKSVWDVISSIGTAIKTFLTSPLGGVILIITGLTTAVSAFVDMWKNGWNIIGEIIKDIGIALAAVGAIILGAPAAIAGVVAAVVAVLSSLAIVIHEHWDAISAWLVEKWNAIKANAQAIWELIGLVISYAIETLSTKIKELWDGITSWLSDCWDNIKSIAETIWTALSETVATIIEKLGSVMQRLWEGIKTTAVNFWTGIKNNLTSIMDGIKTFFTNAWQTISNIVVKVNQTMGDTISKIWNGIVNTIKGAINGILGFINGLVQGVANGINAVINVLNKFKVNIPDWVPGLGGKSFGFNLKTITAPQIKYLAKGGVINTPTLAMMGEYHNAGSNPEIAAPQKLLQDMLDTNNGKLVASFAQMTQQVITAINNVDMEVKIGDDTVAKSAARGNNSYKAMTGRSLITV